MALLAPKMTSCAQKQRCLSGVNKGLAYDKANPCPEGQVFSSVHCDCFPAVNCSAPLKSATIKWKVSYATYDGVCSPVTTVCTDSGGLQYTTTITDLAEGAAVSVFTVDNGIVGTCSDAEGTKVYAGYVTCVLGSPAFKSVFLGSPECSVNTSAGAIATPYDVEVIYL